MLKLWCLLTCFNWFAIYGLLFPSSSLIWFFQCSLHFPWRLCFFRDRGMECHHIALALLGVLYIMYVSQRSQHTKWKKCWCYKKKFFICCDLLDIYLCWVWSYSVYHWHSCCGFLIRFPAVLLCFIYSDRHRSSSVPLLTLQSPMYPMRCLISLSPCDFCQSASQCD